MKTKGANGQVQWNLMKRGFQERKCPNWPQCRERIQKRFLENHLSECPGRKEECKACHEAIVYHLISSHNNVCPKAEIECTNSDCSVKLLREQLKAHKSVCPKEVIPCPYSDSGCNAVIFREDRKKHLEEYIEQHSVIANNTVSELKGKLKDMHRQLNDADRALESRCVVPVTFKMSDYKTKREEGATWRSPYFFTHACGYKLQLQVEVSSFKYDTADYLSAYICMASSPNDDGLVWPFFAKITMQILNQCHDYGHYSRTFSWNDSADVDQMSKSYSECLCDGWGDSELISYTDLENTYNNSSRTYLKDDCVYFHISIDSVATQCKPWLICSQSAPVRDLAYSNCST